MSSRRDLPTEEKTVENIIEMSVKLQYLHTLNNQKKMDLQVEVEPGKQKDNWSLASFKGISVQFSELIKLLKESQDRDGAKRASSSSSSTLKRRLVEYSKQQGKGRKRFEFFSFLGPFQCRFLLWQIK